MKYLKRFVMIKLDDYEFANRDIINNESQSISGLKNNS